jgi:hypothetical protein
VHKFGRFRASLAFDRPHLHVAWHTAYSHWAEIGLAPRERCESGRIGLTANELTWETGSEGSNPSLSAHCFGAVRVCEPPEVLNSNSGQRVIASRTPQALAAAKIRTRRTLRKGDATAATMIGLRQQAEFEACARSSIWIEHLITDQKVGSSSLSGRTATVLVRAFGVRFDR